MNETTIKLINKKIEEGIQLTDEEKQIIKQAAK